MHFERIFIKKTPPILKIIRFLGVIFIAIKFDKEKTVTYTHSKTTRPTSSAVYICNGLKTLCYSIFKKKNSKGEIYLSDIF